MRLPKITPKTAKAGLLTRLPVWAAAMAAVLPQMGAPALAQAADEEEEVQNLGTIVLTATGQAQALPDAPATVTVIDGAVLICTEK